MKRLLLAVSVLVLITGASATTFSQEEVEVDLSNNNVNAFIHVEELTTSSFNYFTEYRISDFNARIDGEPTDCQVETQPLQSDIKCEVPENTTAFDIEMNFTASELTQEDPDRKSFQYSYNIIRPTNNFTLRVLLPEGTGLADSGNISAPVSPQDADITTNGQRIIVEWNRNPRTGDRLSFQILYDTYTAEGFDTTYLIFAAIAGALLVTVAYILYRRTDRQNVESIYEDLTEDQIKVVEILRENEGEMLQKDLVESMEYSKAKVSGLVSELVEKEVLTKEKEGRSNKLMIVKNYRV
jgi:uncharacterized membrane protein